MLSDKVNGSPNRALHIVGAGRAAFIDIGENVFEIAKRAWAVKRTLTIRDDSRARQSLRQQQIAPDGPGPGLPG